MIVNQEVQVFHVAVLEVMQKVLSQLLGINYLWAAQTAVLCNECAYIKAELWSTGQDGWVQQYAIDEATPYEQNTAFIFLATCACNSVRVHAQTLWIIEILQMGLCIYELHTTVL